MRTIKFRGKRIDNGEWVYGYLYNLPLESGNVCMILTTDNIHKDNSIEPQYHLAFTLWKDLFVVDSSTVGQFTGLHDKNGKEIYEGDILRYTRHNVSGDGIHNETWVHECIVYWDEEKHAFWHRMKLSCGSCSGLLIFKDERADKEEIEVIGNIHDNPELIEKYLLNKTKSNGSVH